LWDPITFKFARIATQDEICANNVLSWPASGERTDTDLELDVQTSTEMIYITIDYIAPAQSKTTVDCGEQAAEPTEWSMQVELPNDCSHWYDQTDPANSYDPNGSYDPNSSYDNSASCP
jgi:hypothetical protein